MLLRSSSSRWRDRKIGYKVNQIHLNSFLVVVGGKVRRKVDKIEAACGRESWGVSWWDVLKMKMRSIVEDKEMACRWFPVLRGRVSGEVNFTNGFVVVIRRWGGRGRGGGAARRGESNHYANAPGDLVVDKSTDKTTWQSTGESWEIRLEWNAIIQGPFLIPYSHDNLWLVTGILRKELNQQFQ